MLIAGFGLKLLEMHHKRDAVVLVYVAFFTAAVDCVFTQRILDFGLVLLTYVIATTALVSINQSKTRGFSMGSFTYSAFRMLTTALPLMLALFLIVPRLGAHSGPFPCRKTRPEPALEKPFRRVISHAWSGPMKLAFRVRFDGEIPAREQTLLAWTRVLRVRWKGVEAGGFLWTLIKPILRREGGDESIVRLGEPIRYTLTIEPTHTEALVVRALDTGDPRTRYPPDARLTPGQRRKDQPEAQ